jgi:hypothetical protein
MVDNSIPSRSPVNDDTLTGTFKEILKKFLQSTDDMIPAKILEYNRATNRARVQPLIQVLTTNGDRITRAEIASIPVLFLGGGGFFLSFNLPVDSLGWIKASDRDISLFLQSYEDNPPNTNRLHSFEDSLLIPDIMRGHTIDPEDDQAMVIQNLAGTVRISLDDTRIKMTTPQLEIVTGGTTVTVVDGDVTIDAANTTMNGNLQVNGDIDATGTITGDTEVVGGGISLSTHTHAQGVDSDGNTEQETNAPS